PGPSDIPPPSFEHSANDPLFDFDTDRGFVIPQGGEAPPPDFAPYNAESFISWNGDIISHDPHLNEDGEALYRFLLARAQEHPEFVVRCRGTHTEHRHHTITTTDAQGRTTTQTESRPENVVDFDFKIDLAQHLLPGALLWTAPDQEPAYRGNSLKTTKNGLPATRQANKALKNLQKYRSYSGLPPWVGQATVAESGTVNLETMDYGRQHDVLQSSWTLRQWADDYCSSDKIFKEFVFEKMIYGWKIGVLTSAIRSAIQSTNYTGSISISFDKRLARVIIRRDGGFHRLLSSIWFRILLWILLIYPFIWLFKRFHPQGYGKWAVAGSAHALTRFYANGPPPVGQSAGTAGHAQPEGLREGEWFKRWEETIRRMVTTR
ncbi:hypothetical protein K488DRAFT_25836, partial [Vararia minispora EC-137]